jgi:hypothetical protein
MAAKSKAREPRSREPDFSSDIGERNVAPTSCTSSAAGLTDSPWTTGSEWRPRYWERRSNRKSKQQRDRSS